MAKDIFLISTPYQLLIAEMIRMREGRDSRFVVTTGYLPNVQQIMDAGKVLGVAQSINFLTSLSYRAKGRFARIVSDFVRYRGIRALEGSLKQGDRVLIGFWQNLFAAKFLTEPRSYEIAFFDEGIASIDFLSVRASGERRIELSPRKWSSPLSVFHPESVLIESLHYFTIYPGLTGAPEDRVIGLESTIPCLRRVPGRSNREVWIIGGPVVQAGIVSASEYTEMLVWLRDTLSPMGLKLIYFPHRTEDPCFWKSADVETRSPELPFELFYARSSDKPVAITSVISSVLYHMKIFFDDRPLLFFTSPRGGVLSEEAVKALKYGGDVMNIVSIERGDSERLRVLVQSKTGDEQH